MQSIEFKLIFTITGVKHFKKGEINGSRRFLQSYQRI